MTLAICKPIELTDVMLVASSVLEDDAAVWAVGTTYALGARVMVLSTHKIYESLQASNTGNSPPGSPTFWIEVGPTNRWRAFDSSISTQTTDGALISYTINPGQAINTVALLNLDADAVMVRLTDPVEGVVFEREQSLLNGEISASTWYDYFFDSPTRIDTFVALDVPTYKDASLEVEISGGGTIAVGVVMFGFGQRVGEGVELGARVGIQDYSRKERNEFGDTVLVQRAFSKRAEFSMLVRNGEVDALQILLSRIRATPVLWVGYDQITALTLFGFFKDFDISIAYPTHSECTIDIEGLT